MIYHRADDCHQGDRIQKEMVEQGDLSLHSR